MPKKSLKVTTAADLESKFDNGEDVLDYFDLESAEVVLPGAPTAGVLTGLRIVEWKEVTLQLKRAVTITEQIQELQKELHSILGT